MIFSRKNTLKDDISGITEKVYIHPRKCGISSDRKTKDDKKVIFCTFTVHVLLSNEQKKKET